MIPRTREHATLAGRASVELTADAIARHDLVMVVTDHRDVDYPLVADHAKLVVDTRNIFARLGIDGVQVEKA